MQIISSYSLHKSAPRDYNHADFPVNVTNRRMKIKHENRTEL